MAGKRGTFYAHQPTRGCTLGNDPAQGEWHEGARLDRQIPYAHIGFQGLT